MSILLQNTIKESVELEGVGLHNGIKANLCIKPAEANTGIKFIRTDVDSSRNEIEAIYKNVSSPILCTKIKNSHGISVSTIEHLMAAFYGEGIDNAIVEIDAPEVPIMDGSAFDFVMAIKTAGIEKQKISRKYINVLKKVELKDGSKHISIEPLYKDLIIDFEIIYKNPLIRTRRKKFSVKAGDMNAIYNSKTFCLYEDIDHIKSLGLAKGGSLDNAIVVKENKILNENGLRYRDEFVNHKILDCIGDLMLAGHRVFGHIKTSQGGHQLTNTLLTQFLSEKSNWEFQNFEAKSKDEKGSSYTDPIAVSA
tara:strand:- start:645 stop:1571 length:927 start_codon:yes stop_codon:yes gene_type:complete